MPFKPVLKNLILALAASSFALSAVAQWQWIDKDGRKVFSDRSPPAEIKEKDILKRPGGVRLASVPSTDTPEAVGSPASASVPAVTASAPKGKASSPKPTGKDAELEAKKKAAEDEAAAKQKIEDDKAAAARAENCERAKRYLITLKSGIRIANTNAQGEKEFMNDAKRVDETKRAENIAASECK